MRFEDNDFSVWSLMTTCWFVFQFWAVDAQVLSAHQISCHFFAAGHISVMLLLSFNLSALVQAGRLGAYVMSSYVE